MLFRFGFVVLVCAALSVAQSQSQDIIPQRIVLNLTAEPARSMAVTWRTIGEVKHPVAQIAESGDWTDFDRSARNANATSEKQILDTKEVVYSHSVILDGLKPDVMYAYRVGGDTTWSEWNQFTTAKDETAPFDFVFLGDPQYQIKSFCSRIFREALLAAPNAKFWLLTGDLMDLPQYDRFWVEWFEAAGFIHSIVPSIIAPGSHEYALKTGEEVVWDKFSPTWNAHFTFPHNGPKGCEGKVYYVDYQ
jgi:acid phosphatase type 7